MSKNDLKPTSSKQELARLLILFAIITVIHRNISFVMDGLYLFVHVQACWEKMFRDYDLDNALIVCIGCAGVCWQMSTLAFVTDLNCNP